MIKNRIQRNDILMKRNKIWNKLKESIDRAIDVLRVITGRRNSASFSGPICVNVFSGNGQ